MGSFSIWHWLVVLAVILVLFGGGNKISGLMGDFAKGIKSFKKNMADPDDESMEEANAKPTGTIAPPGPRATTATREPSTTS
jgi:sec-independent protein translocase protein TatA